MFRTKKTIMNSTALEAGDIIDIAGVQYLVVDNEPNPFSVHKRSLTLTTVNSVSDMFGDQVFMIMPSFLPMTIIKKK